MIKWLSGFIDKASEYLAHRRGLLPMAGLALIVVNLIFQFILPPGVLRDSNLFLHLGLILAIFGLMLAWAL
jgi:hypothetical protein